MKNLSSPHPLYTRFLSSPTITRVPFFLLFGFNKGTTTIKRANGYRSPSSTTLIRALKGPLKGKWVQEPGIRPPQQQH